MSHHHHEHQEHHHHGHQEHHHHAHHHHAHGHSHIFAVTGVTGNTGAATARALLAGGHKVRGLVRDVTSKKSEELKAAGVELHVVQGLTDVAGLTAAFTGVDGVFLMTPPVNSDVDIRAAHLLAVGAFEKAIADAKVKKAVILSSVGAHQTAGTGLILKLHDFEQVFSKHTELDIAFLRAGYFAENVQAVLGAVKTGVYPSFIKADAVIPIVATNDIGTEAANLLVDHFTGHRYVALEGPERLTPTQIAGIFSKILNKPVALNVVPEEQILPAVQAFGTPDFTKALAELNTGVNHGIVVFEGGKEESVKGTTTFETFVTPLLK